MIHTRFRKIYRDIVARKTRTALVCISIFIGVMGVVALFSMSDIVVDRLESTIHQERLAMARVYVSLSSPEDVDNAATLDTLNQIPDVTAVQGLALKAVYWKLPGTDEFTEARLFAYSQPFESLLLEPIELVEGRFPEASQHEIVVERRFAAAHGVSVGDELVLQVLGSADGSIDVREESFTIVGALYLPYQYPTTPGQPSFIKGSSMLFGTMQDAATITASPGFTMIQLRYADFPLAKAGADALEATLTDETSYVPVQTIVEDPAKNAFIEQSRSFGNALSMLAVVALIVAGFLVFNVINQLVFEQRAQIGAMKSLGATGRDNFLIYGGISLVYGVIGMIPGVLAGAPLGFVGARNLANQFDIFIEDFRMSGSAILLGIFLGLVVPVLAAIIPVLLGIRVTILDAITDRGIDARYGFGPLPRLIERLPVPITTRQAFSNIARKKGRLALTIVTLSLAAGAFMGVYAVITAFSTVVDSLYGAFGNEISINPADVGRSDALLQTVRSDVNGITAIEPGVNLAINIDGYTPEPVGGSPALLFAQGINPSNPELVHFDLLSGSGWQEDPTREGVILTAAIANSLGKSAGDSVDIRIGSRQQAFEIIGVTNSPFDIVWFQWQQLAAIGGMTGSAPTPNQYTTTVQVDGESILATGIDEAAQVFLTFREGGPLTVGEPGIIMTNALADAQNYEVGHVVTLTSGENTLDYPIIGIFELPPDLREPDAPDEAIGMYWEDLARLEGLSLDGDPLPNTYSVIMDAEDPPAEAVDAKIREINDALLQAGIAATYINWVESADLTAQVILTAAVVLNTAAFLIGAVGAIGLLTTLSMSVLERQKEIGVMRSIGASSQSIAAQFLTEGLIVGTIAWLIGIPLSFVLFRALIVAFNFGDMAGLDYMPITIVVGLVGTLTLAAISSISPALNAARKTVSDILRYQ